MSYRAASKLTIDSMVEMAIRQLGQNFSTAAQAQRGVMETILEIQAEVAWDESAVGSILASDVDLLDMDVPFVLSQIPRINRRLGKAEKLGKDLQSIMLASIALIMEARIRERWDVVLDEIQTYH